MLAKLVHITIGDVITMAIAAIAVAIIVGDFNIGALIGVVIGNRVFALMDNK